MAACTEWYTRTTRCRNGITEKTKYPVRYTDGRPGRSARRKAARKAGRAGDNAERIFARLLNNNFTEGRAVHLAMTYSPAGYRRLEARAAAIMQQLPGIPERDAIFRAAQKEFENFVRRVQYELKGFVYIASTSDMDGKSLEPERVHHHVIIEREALEICRRKWAKYGVIYERELYSSNGDFTPLASYIIKQVREVPGTKRYTHSRNIELPEATEPRLVTRYSASELSIPSGAQLLYRSPFTFGASQYVRYREPVRQNRGPTGPLHSSPGLCSYRPETVPL